MASARRRRTWWTPADEVKAELLKEVQRRPLMKYTDEPPPENHGPPKKDAKDLVEKAFLTYVRSDDAYVRLENKLSTLFSEVKAPIDKKGVWDLLEPLCRVCWRECERGMVEFKDEASLFCLARTEARKLRKDLDNINLAFMKQLSALKTGHTPTSTEFGDETVQFYDPLNHLDPDTRDLVLALVAEKVAQIKNGTAPNDLVKAVCESKSLGALQRQRTRSLRSLWGDDSDDDVEEKLEETLAQLEETEDIVRELEADNRQVKEQRDVAETRAEHAEQRAIEAEFQRDELVEELHKEREERRNTIFAERESLRTAKEEPDEPPEAPQPRRPEVRPEQVAAELKAKAQVAAALKALQAQKEECAAWRSKAEQLLQGNGKVVESAQLELAREEAEKLRQRAEAAEASLRQKEAIVEKLQNEVETVRSDLEGVAERNARKSRRRHQATQTDDGPNVDKLIAENKRLKVGLEEMRARLGELMNECKRKGLTTEQIDAIQESVGLRPLMKAASIFERLHQEAETRAARLDRLREKHRPAQPPPPPRMNMVSVDPGASVGAGGAQAAAGVGEIMHALSQSKLDEQLPTPFNAAVRGRVAGRGPNHVLLNDTSPPPLTARGAGAGAAHGVANLHIAAASSPKQHVVMLFSEERQPVKKAAAPPPPAPLRPIGPPLEVRKVSFIPKSSAPGPGAHHPGRGQEAPKAAPPAPLTILDTLHAATLAQGHPLLSTGSELKPGEGSVPPSPRDAEQMTVRLTQAALEAHTRTWPAESSLSPAAAQTTRSLLGRQRIEPLTRQPRSPSPSPRATASGTKGDSATQSSWAAGRHAPPSADPRLAQLQATSTTHSSWRATSRSPERRKSSHATASSWEQRLQLSPRRDEDSEIIESAWEPRRRPVPDPSSTQGGNVSPSWEAHMRTSPCDPSPQATTLKALVSLPSPAGEAAGDASDVTGDIANADGAMAVQEERELEEVPEEEESPHDEVGAEDTGQRGSGQQGSGHQGSPGPPAPRQPVVLAPPAAPQFHLSPRRMGHVKGDTGPKSNLRFAPEARDGAQGGELARRLAASTSLPTLPARAGGQHGRSNAAAVPSIALTNILGARDSGWR